MAMSQNIDVVGEESDLLIVKPLGSGREVGRSCIMLEFKGKKIMLDCGIHPGLSGMDALPYTDLVDAEEIDLLLVSHFHLDHCGALPWFLEKTTFRGRVFMTHATKAIYKWLLSDYIKVSNLAAEQMLYSDTDLEKSMEKIETINFHQEKEVGGVKFWCYNAGHVLGAAMFMIEIAGVRVLYTGDFSRQEDRHLMSAEIPNIKPEVLICESTYGTHIHEEREVRESRFTSLVYDIVNRGGRCLIPVFALGRAQELLLILDEFWQSHPELHDVPIYYASSLAKKCMMVYQTFISAMNERIRKQISYRNPFIFKHINNLKSIEHFEDLGPCVVLASPGMMQSGLSRELFEGWCTDTRNGVIIAGYCVEGTLAKHILTEPEEITTSSGHKLPMKCSVDYISFSAHTDYKQTSEFVRILKPPNIVLVHGEQNEMGRLKTALIREYEDDPDHNLEVYNPRNTEAVKMYFRGEKFAKVVGKLAEKKAENDELLSGVLIKRNWNYHLMSPSDLANYSDLSESVVRERQSVSYSGSYTVLYHYLSQLSGDCETVKHPHDKASAGSGSHSTSALRMFDGSVLCVYDEDKRLVILEWQASPVNDAFADAIVNVILKATLEPIPISAIPKPIHIDSMYFRETLLEMFEDMFGDNCVNPTVKSNKMTLVVGSHQATIDLSSLEVTCGTNETLEQMVKTAVTNLHRAIFPLLAQ